MNKMILAAVLAALAGCASTGFVPMDKDTYLLVKRSPQIGLGPADGVKAEVYYEANAFCAKENKKVETIKLEMNNAGFARPASTSLQFRCTH